MENNLFSRWLKLARQVMVYQPPANPSRFVLAETKEDNLQLPSEAGEGSGQAMDQLQTLLRYADRLVTVMEDLRKYLRNGGTAGELSNIKAKYAALKAQQSELDPLLLGYYADNETIGHRPVSAALEENHRNIETIYELPLNKGLIIRPFNLPARPPAKALLVYLDGLCDKKTVSRTVLEPLMRNSLDCGLSSSQDLLSCVIDRYLPAGGAQRALDFTAIQDGINSGDAALFIDGIAEAVLVEAKGPEHRAVERPLTEQSVRGAQNSFTEILNINLALIRSSAKISDLITETMTVGTRSRTKCAVIYIKSLTNRDLVEEVKRRISGIQTDFISNIGELEDFIVDSPFHPYPQTLSTERPDRVYAHLAEGRVAILLDGSPFALVAPIELFTLLHTSEDFALSFLYSAFLRIIRIVGMLVSALLPAIYIAISVFHPETLPTELLQAISTARQQVPFPTIVEIILMELSFELVREGGIRIPGFLGPTIGIVGAVILGQAGVMAKIVSPIMVIIIAVTGLASYTVPDFRLANALRFTRFAFLLVGATLGLVGVASGMILWLATLTNLKSFGVAYLVPVTPRTVFGVDVVVRWPAFSRDRRPDYLGTKDPTRQPKISRSWIRNQPERGE